MSNQEARKLLRALQKALPTIYPIRYERCELTDCWGECLPITRRGRKYLVVRVADWLSWPADLLVLLHEFAHARTWHVDRVEALKTSDHCAEWGVKLAEVWRKALKEK